MLLAPCLQPLLAQDYPQKTIRLIVPYTPGGTADMLARAIGQKMAESLGQQIIIDNRPGAGGNIGADLVAKAAPDGYTILVGTVATHAINPNLYSNIPYNAAKDFAPSNYPLVVWIVRDLNEAAQRLGDIHATPVEARTWMEWKLFFGSLGQGIGQIVKDPSGNVLTFYRRIP